MLLVVTAVNHSITAVFYSYYMCSNCNHLSFIAVTVIILQYFYSYFTIFSGWVAKKKIRLKGGR